MTHLIEKANDSIMLESSMINRLGWNEESLLAIIVKDDSMEPTIQNDTRAIIDRSQTAIQDNKVYALRIREAIYLRRIIRSIATDNMVLIPDSATFYPDKNHKTQELTHNDFEIIGRVVSLWYIPI